MDVENRSPSKGTLEKVGEWLLRSQSPEEFIEEMLFGILPTQLRREELEQPAGLAVNVEALPAVVMVPPMWKRDP